MSRKSRYASLVSLAVLAAALGGCASTQTTSSTAPQPATLGSNSSPYVQTTVQPFSVSNCMKFEAVPQECEHALRGQ